MPRLRALWLTRRWARQKAVTATRRQICMCGQKPALSPPVALRTRNECGCCPEGPGSSPRSRIALPHALARPPRRAHSKREPQAEREPAHAWRSSRQRTTDEHDSKAGCERKNHVRPTPARGHAPVTAACCRLCFLLARPDNCRSRTWPGWAVDVPMRAKEPVCANGAIPPASTAWCRHPPVPPPVAPQCGGTSSHSP